MPGPLKDYWTEFDWEAELKKDDARISTYMQELPRYIDLPSEDAVIMKHIQDKPELVPFGGDYKNSSLAGLFENTDYEEDITFSEEWQKRDGSDFYIVLGRLSKLWAQYFASLGGRRPSAECASFVSTANLWRAARTSSTWRMMNIPHSVWRS